MTRRTIPLEQQKEPRPFWTKIARALFLLATAIAAIIVIASDRGAIVEALSRTDPILLCAALVVSLVNVTMTAVSWRLLLDNAAVHLPWKVSARIFFLGQMGKYLPGSVWSYLASAELAKEAGLSRQTALSSLLLAVIIGLGSGILVALAVLPEATDWLPLDWWVAPIAILPLTLFVWPAGKIALLKLAKIDFAIQTKSLLGSASFALLAWAFAGAQVWLVALALGLPLGSDFVIAATGMYALAWVTGFLFFIAPAGLGAREGVLTALLATSIALPDAIIVALLSRVIVTLADFVLGGSALLINPRPDGQSTARPLRQV